MIDEWTPLSRFLGDMIAKYIDQIDIDSLPDPEEFYKMKCINDQYKMYMRLIRQSRKTV